MKKTNVRKHVNHARSPLGLKLMGVKTISDNAPGENSTEQNIKDINEGETKAAKPLLK